MRKRRLKKKVKIALSIGIIVVSTLTYFILDYLGAYKDVFVIGSNYTIWVVLASNGANNVVIRNMEEMI